MDDDIGVWAQGVVEGVVLQVGRVKVGTCVLVDSVLTDEFGEVVHGEEVWVVPARG